MAYKYLIVDDPYLDEEGFRHIPNDVLPDASDYAFLSDLDVYDKAVLGALGASDDFEIWYYNGQDA